MGRVTTLNHDHPATTPASSSSRRATPREAVESRKRLGKTLVVAGWISAVIGVVLYCVASFAGDADADLAAIVLHGAVPAARAALAVIGGGTLLWIVGSVVHINAALDEADLESGRDPERHAQS
ncbi:MAG TPA: hypothetical protein VFK85_11510 [Anaeromyxobacteraceae bacterium]|nr:hypothetical protein [Anaeromyxobacteraceae bacterium]